MNEARQTIRVLVADDSSATRSLLRMLFAPATMLGASMFARRPLPRIELCGVAADGIECIEAVHALKPDILILDLEMPRMDGLAVLDRLRKEESKLPVIVCSSMTERGAAITLDSLARGAMDYVTKPSVQGDVEAALINLGRQLLPRIMAISEARQQIARAPASQPALTVPISAATPVLYRRRSEEPPYVVVIGISTGGPAALEQVLSALPADFPLPILIAQHMPRLFSAVLAERLDRHSALHVKHAVHGEKIAPGTVYVCPGDWHMEVACGADSATVISLHQHEQVNHCRPAADLLFRSAARYYGPHTLGLLMTGMGSDGLAGSQEIVAAGGAVLVQDAATSIVWGMPGKVAHAGIASAILPLNSIAGELMTRAASPAVSARECA